MTTVLVDVANTMGARPDGWWRDRAGAAVRLLTPLAALVGTTVRGPDGTPLELTGLVAVVEGRARDVDVPPPVRVVRAPASGDDALARTAADLAAAGEDLLVVTADRGLRARLPDGVAVTGPRWALGLVEKSSSTG